MVVSPNPTFYQWINHKSQPSSWHAVADGRSGPSSAVLPKAGSLQPTQRRAFQPGRWGGPTYPHANAPKLSRRFGRFSGSPDSRLRLAPTVYLSQTGPGLLGHRPSGRRRRARASPLCRRITKRAEGRQPGLRNRRRQCRARALTGLLGIRPAALQGSPAGRLPLPVAKRHRSHRREEAGQAGSGSAEETEEKRLPPSCYRRLLMGGP